MNAAEKRAYRITEKRVAAEVSEKAQRLVDARGYAEIYMARLMLAQAMDRLVYLAQSRVAS